MASLVLPANAVTNMYVEQTDGTITPYNVETIDEVYYAETESETGKIGNHAYVDLDLPSGTLWATYNIGADNPSETGDYYSWGEVETKEDYSKEEYKWGVSPKITKYCDLSDNGEYDGKKQLDSEDDVATVKWGSEWRMPTEEEITELIAGCEWEWTNDYNTSGAAGMLGTSKKNGNSIFLIAAGYRDYQNIYCIDENSYQREGYYWSNTLTWYSYSNNDAQTITIYEKENPEYQQTDLILTEQSKRHLGISVRAVVAKK